MGTLIETILNWVYTHSDSDYIFSMNGHLAKKLNLLERHEAVMPLIEALDKSQAGRLPPRLVASVEGEVWRYTIGGYYGGTIIEISPTQLSVISRLNARGNYAEKGRVTISISKDSFLHPEVVMEWKLREGDHSWGRLKDLLRYMEKKEKNGFAYLITHKGRGEAQVRGFCYLEEAGGGW